jgi:uncharacterized membrane protein
MRLAKYVDRPLLFLNLLLLLFVVMIPFSTGLLSEYIRDGDNSHVAAAVYSGTMLMVGLAFQAMWRWIVSGGRLLHESLDSRTERSARARFGIGVFAYSTTIALSFWSAMATLLLHLLIAVYYMFDQLIAGTPGDRVRRRVSGKTPRLRRGRN